MPSRRPPGCIPSVPYLCPKCRSRHLTAMQRSPKARYPIAVPPRGRRPVFGMRSPNGDRLPVSPFRVPRSHPIRARTEFRRAHWRALDDGQPPWFLDIRNRLPAVPSGSHAHWGLRRSAGILQNAAPEPMPAERNSNDVRACDRPTLSLLGFGHPRRQVRSSAVTVKAPRRPFVVHRLSQKSARSAPACVNRQTVFPERRADVTYPSFLSPLTAKFTSLSQARPRPTSPR